VEIKPPRRIYETVLYASDVSAARDFYERVMGFQSLFRSDDLGAAFRLEGGAMLLLFDPEKSSESGRMVPSHGARGPGHVAFSVDSGTIGEWKERLKRYGLTVERELSWDRGGRSIYFRDPAGNSIELIDGEAWGGARAR
jgi:catechol 2,3-dioxygenase-like lactoylglutathione lyase family enzyme